jgi:hypothetical protein
MLKDSGNCIQRKVKCSRVLFSAVSDWRMIKFYKLFETFWIHLLLAQSLKRRPTNLNPVYVAG